MAYALVALKMLASVDRLMTVPLGELLRRGVPEEDVLCAWDELVARALVRLMTPEGWKVPVEDVGAASNGGGRMVARNLPYWSRSVRTVIPSTRNKGFLGAFDRNELRGLASSCRRNVERIHRRQPCPLGLL
jgi:hypothetical protein